MVGDVVQSQGMRRLLRSLQALHVEGGFRKPLVIFNALLAVCAAPADAVTQGGALPRNPFADFFGGSESEVDGGEGDAAVSGSESGGEGQKEVVVMSVEAVRALAATAATAVVPSYARDKHAGGKGGYERFFTEGIALGEGRERSTLDVALIARVSEHGRVYVVLWARGRGMFA